MRPQWLVWVVFAFVIGNAMCLILDGVWIGTAEQNFFNALLGFQVMSYTDSTMANIGITIANFTNGLIGFFTHALPKLVAWDYSFLDGGWSVIKWFLLWPISAGTVLGVILSFRR
ncbi:hypothetical protein SDC9_42707 [bioreactor metagenome]|uniref:Membrane protein, putative n=2 Tax=root TaxID=1 RepID=Q3Z9R9_DEHM1|nr:hypothetical protein [Dehalococcoides mccartyi]AAW39821.1 membrane protein, putative [Dehalococcoides mccartyi 195]AAW40410.1 membrane protein, putative [Dehalococcoides mccartyi 195]AAW40457.1 membrane protein, putative [Dehalococcoides mccartyi 195]MEA4878857.1 hypothetical protein [Dehalococcoides mccartyi]